MFPKEPALRDLKISILRCEPGCRGTGEFSGGTGLGKIKDGKG
jgi:hypothetical protein